MLAEVKRRKAKSGVVKDSKSKLERCLRENSEEDDEYFQSNNFMVLSWWKKRRGLFPILSVVARDVLAILVSTVASESTFSTEGRIGCSSEVEVNVEENIEDLDQFEDDLRQLMAESAVLDI
ncbi:unnamed protein product [Lactuca virosa]|uniref:HAT C-terminal dimerisation domain-containing protein n=1 Tax=Lactuca virosa TaxID=75947 RepID=A0AAU9MXM5_9ASTR|nr:unnamed protein product [Lactuca virosa]